MTDSSCKICLETWPLKDHLLGDCGLTTAYLFEDQFFEGWTVLVLKNHVCELFELSKEARGLLMEEVNYVAQILARMFDAKKMNYELLGNQVRHIHWHLIPRLTTDPNPLKPVWCVPHDPVRLSANQLAERAGRLRSALHIAPYEPARFLSNPGKILASGNFRILPFIPQVPVASKNSVKVWVMKWQILLHGNR